MAETLSIIFHQRIAKSFRKSVRCRLYRPQAELHDKKSHHSIASMKITNIISQFIPILLIYFFLVEPVTLMKFSHTILGRLLAVFIILYYSALEKSIGLFVCGLTILFYQSDAVEGFSTIQMENFADYVSEEPTAQYENISNVDEAKTQFRKDFCESGLLKYKGLPVKFDMVQHIFPEIEFHNIKCNPCSNKCAFSIIEEKLKVEEKMKPISTLM